MNEIIQQKIKLNKDERNSTNNKNENDRLNMILSVIDRIYQFFEYKIAKIGKSKQKRFNEMLSTVIKAKNEGLRINVDETEITLDNTDRLLKDTASGK